MIDFVHHILVIAYLCQGQFILNNAKVTITTHDILELGSRSERVDLIDSVPHIQVIA